MNEEIKRVKDYLDFRKVYGIFKEHPFYEAWTEELFAEEYDNIIKTGDVFGCYVDNKIVSLLNIIYGAEETHPVKFDNPEKVIYISDIATLNSHRNKGYADKLTKFCIEYSKLLNYYNEIYLRTNLNGSMSEKMFIKNGFEIMKKDDKIITQDVYFERTKKDMPLYDTRKFLSRSLIKK